MLGGVWFLVVWDMVVIIFTFYVSAIAKLISARSRDIGSVCVGTVGVLRLSG